VTTIQIDEETKKRLLEIGGELQAQLKRNISFNDTIKFLINEQCEGFRLSALLPLFGSLNTEPDDVRRILLDLRKEEEARLERPVGRPND